MTKPFKYEKTNIYYSTESYKEDFIALFYVMLFLFSLYLIVGGRDFIFGYCCFSIFIKTLVGGLCCSIVIALIIAPFGLLKTFLKSKIIHIEIYDNYFKITKFSQLFIKKEIKEIYYDDISFIDSFDSFRNCYHIHLKDSVFDLPQGYNQELLKFMLILMEHYKKNI